MQEVADRFRQLSPSIGTLLEFTLQCVGEGEDNSRMSEVADSIKNQSAMDIIERLASDSSLCDTEVTRLLHLHSLLRPEIFPAELDGDECQKEIRALFRRDVPPIRHLVSQVAVRCSCRTIQRLMGLLLEQFDKE